MKVSKTAFVDFLNKVSLKGMIQEVVIEENGMVGTVPQTKEHDKDCIIFGSFPDLGFKSRIGLGDVAMLAKIVNSLETADNLVNIDLQDSCLVVAARNGKYSYRLAQADAITSVVAGYAEASEKLKALESMELSLTSVLNLKKAIANLTSDRVSFYAHDGILEAVVHDDGTKSSATIELGMSKKSYKKDFPASTLSRVLDTIDTDGTMMYGDESDKSPVVIQLKSKQYLYMVSPYVEVKLGE